MHQVEKITSWYEFIKSWAGQRTSINKIVKEINRIIQQNNAASKKALKWINQTIHLTNAFSCVPYSSRAVAGYQELVC